MPILKMDGVNLYYEIMGQGPAILFIHPPGLTSVCFTQEAALLSGNHKIILVDIRGHGKSSPSMEPVTYPLVAKDFIRLMDNLGIQKAYFCGYSMGGSIVLELLLHYPLRILGGILIGGFPEVSDFLLKSKILIGTTLSNRRTSRTLAFGLAASHANSIKMFWQSVRSFMRCHVPNVRQYFQYGLQYRVTEHLPQILSPVLLIYGKKDTGFHDYGQLLKNKLTNGTLTFIPGAGHRIPIFFPNELCAMIAAFVKNYTN
jgi:pimeloyl-ACP methyl ester carboxylesterase